MNPFIQTLNPARRKSHESGGPAPNQAVLMATSHITGSVILALCRTELLLGPSE